MKRVDKEMRVGIRVLLEDKGKWEGGLYSPGK